jgi:hypothetical protein
MSIKKERFWLMLVVGAVLMLVWGALSLSWDDIFSAAPAWTPTPTRTATPLPPTATPTASLTPTPSATPTMTPTPTPSPTATPTPTPSPTLTPSPTPTLTPSPLPEAAAPDELLALAEMTDPNDTRPSLFRRRLFVGLYGTTGPGLGILGTASATNTVTMTREVAAEYQALLTDTLVIPGFHMVVTIADAFPGEEGRYSHRVSTDTLQTWIDVAQTHQMWSVLDIQPGHSAITEELAFVAPFVRQSNVHLAIDPEFVMSETTRIPGQHIGMMDGETLNLAQAWLNGIAEETGERKMLVIHQFDDRMFTDKAAIRDYHLVDLVWDSDGFGGPFAKIKDYDQYAAEPGFEYSGFKIFYNYDTPVMTPARVLGLTPRPVFVIYQ